MAELHGVNTSDRIARLRRDLAAAEARVEASEQALAKMERRARLLLLTNVGSEPSDYDRQVYYLAHEVIAARAALSAGGGNADEG